MRTNKGVIKYTNIAPTDQTVARRLEPALKTLEIPQMADFPDACPKCKGWGEKIKGPYWAKDNTVKCSVCNGTGWVGGVNPFKE